jgi:serine/threonine protein kinase
MMGEPRPMLIGEESFQEAREAARARRKAKTAQRKRYEALVNQKTLHEPLNPRSRYASSALRDFLLRLVERDVSKRISNAPEARKQAFLADVEWELLEAQRLPAPYTPQPGIVYMPDTVEPLNFLGDEAEFTPQSVLEDRASKLDGWPYTVGDDAFAEELTAYVQKYSAVSAA